MMADRTARAALVVAVAAASLGGARSSSAETSAPATSFEVVVPEGTARLAKAAGLDPATALPALRARYVAATGPQKALVAQWIKAADGAKP